MPASPTGWGKICVGTRLEKMVDAMFVLAHANLIKRGLRKGDAFLLEAGKPAHVSANCIIRKFLRRTDCDTLWFLDSDADIGWNFLNEFRDFEPGWVYDGLQAFHTRRGWPPEPIWFKEQGGTMMQCMILTEGTEDVAMIGTHCAMFRREIFERIYAVHGKPNHILLDDFEWFTYPRHERKSDEATLSIEARALGFRLGATTAVKAGHISRVTMGWDTYHEYLELSGTRRRTEMFMQMAGEIGEWTGETAEVVMRKALDSPREVARSWGVEQPETADEYRSAYNNGYLYKILLWNTTPLYERITQPLHDIVGKSVLVVGSGIGSEALILADVGNQVDCFDIPGEIREYAKRRLGDKAFFLVGPVLQDALTEWHPDYDVAVAIDVLEHIHPDEFNGSMDALAKSIKPDGILYCHNNWTTEAFPEHFDNSALFDAWCKRWGFLQESEFVWRKQSV